MDFVNEGNMGEILSYWNKKMLSQVFKWDDKAKGLILDNIDEAKDILMEQLMMDVRTDDASAFEITEMEQDDE